MGAGRRLDSQGDDEEEDGEELWGQKRLDGGFGYDGGATTITERDLGGGGKKSERTAAGNRLGYSESEEEITRVSTAAPSSIASTPTETHTNTSPALSPPLQPPPTTHYPAPAAPAPLHIRQDVEVSIEHEPDPAGPRRRGGNDYYQGVTGDGKGNLIFDGYEARTVVTSASAAKSGDGGGGGRR